MHPGNSSATGPAFQEYECGWCHRQGHKDGQSFAHYVDYITANVLTYAKTKASIDQIRQIGNDANHDITFVTQPDAEKAMRIITYLLDTLYAFPQAHAPPAKAAPTT